MSQVQTADGILLFRLAGKNNAHTSVFPATAATLSSLIKSTAGSMARSNRPSSVRTDFSYQDPHSICPLGLLARLSASPWPRTRRPALFGASGLGKNEKLRPTETQSAYGRVKIFVGKPLAPLILTQPVCGWLPRHTFEMILAGQRTMRGSTMSFLVLFHFAS